MFKESTDDTSNLMEDILEEKLDKFGMMRLGDVSDKMKNYLIEIETTIQHFITKRQEIINEYKKYKISQKTICENGNVNFTRQTINNNKDILGFYIENRKKEVDEEEKDIYGQLNYYKERNKVLENSLKQMQQEVVGNYCNMLEVESLKSKIKKLESQLKKEQGNKY